MSGRTPRALALVHACVFVGLAVAAVFAARGEWHRLVIAWTRPFHVGAAPHVVALVGSAAAAVLGLLVLTRALRRTPVPLGLSLGVLVGLLGGLTGAPPPSRAEREEANGRLLRLAERVTGDARQRLQATGEVPSSLTWWRETLGTAHTPAFRDRRFQPVPYGFALTQEEAPEVPTDDARPGTMLLFVSPDRVRFTLTPLGLDEEGRVARLRDAMGKPVVLDGMFH